MQKVCFTPLKQAVTTSKAHLTEKITGIKGKVTHTLNVSVQYYKEI
jgi:hypothetical protein